MRSLARDVAAEAARDAARRAGVVVRVVDELEDLRRACGLLAAIWGTEERLLLPTELARTLSHAGNYVAVAEDRDTGAVGAAIVAFIGVWEGEYCLQSHVLGVHPSLRHRGVGYALKLHQRAWALQRGLERIAWTFDPLVARNAYFNIAKLGGEAVRYYVDFYGRMTDAINRGDETDRLLVVWPLGAAPAGVVRSEGAPVPVLAVGPDGEPERREQLRPDAEAACQVPPDIALLRAERPEVAARWRHEVRDVLVSALAEGRRIVVMGRDGWYLLSAAPGPR